MATAAEAGMVAGSNIVTGAGTSSRTFTLPASPLYRVEAVVAHVDNTAGADTTATLTYADTNGEVIAKRPQESAVPAGDTGTATFALRLASGGGVRFNKHNRGGYFWIDAAGRIEMDATGGDATISSDQAVRLAATDDISITYGETVAVFEDPATFVTLISSVVGFWGKGIHTFVDAGFPFDIRPRSDPSPAAHVPLFRVENDGTTTVGLRIGAALSVVSEGIGEIFRVDANGDLHGLTGKALTFDL